MMLKINAVNFTSGISNGNRKTVKIPSITPEDRKKNRELLGSNFAASMQAMNNISPKGEVYISAPDLEPGQKGSIEPGDYAYKKSNVSKYEDYKAAADKYKTSYHEVSFDEFYIPPRLDDLQSIALRDDELRIPNILDCGSNFSFPVSKLPYSKAYLNPNGINVIKTDEGNKDVYKVTNDDERVLFIAKFDKDIKNRPVITYKQGKYEPEITVKDKSLNGNVIKMFEGSEIIGDGFELIMPGEFKTSPTASVRDVSFTGNENNLYITTMHMEPKTVEATKRYFDANLQNEAIKGDFADVVQEGQPIGVIPAGGHGTRLLNLTRKNENKPSSLLPTNENYRMMASTLNSMAGAGMFDGLSADDVIYISQAGDIKGENVYYSEKHKTDGGAISEALIRNIIPNSRDVIILNADIFTNADVSRTYNALATLPDAGLIIPYYPVDAQRAKSFGLLGVEVDENGNNQIKTFIEKPKYTTTPPNINDFSDDDEFEEAIKVYTKSKKALRPGSDDIYMANPGMYFLSPEVAKILMMQNLLEPGKTGLGRDVMPKVIDLINQGKLINKDGNPVKAYTIPLEAKGGKPAVWDDLGTAEAYLSLIKDVANEVKLNGTGEDNKYYGIPEKVLNDFANNTDLKNGIVYLSEKARNAFEDFKEKYHIDTAHGNIFVTAGSVENI